MTIESGSQRLILIPLLAPTRQGNQRYRLSQCILPNEARHLVTVEPGHADIDERYFRFECGKCGHCRVTIVHHVDIMAIHFQEHRQGFRSIPIVIGQKNAAAR
jgi:hypothetical protein